MEENFHPNLAVLGERIRSVRKKREMTQIEFYRFLYPNDAAEDENIKKKMNSLENGKGKRIDFNFYARLHDKLELSFDYLLGYENEYPNYENKAVCEYTGLKPETIEQLYFWNKCRTNEIASPPGDLNTKTSKKNYLDLSRKREAAWILKTVDLLFEKKTFEEEKTGISDLSLLYDLYMLSMDVPDRVHGSVCVPCLDDTEYKQIVTLTSDNISFTDSMGEVHCVDLRKINRQIWQQRLIRDSEEFADNISKRITEEYDT